jgi:hypothetical protein
MIDATGTSGARQNRVCARAHRRRLRAAHPAHAMCRSSRCPTPGVKEVDDRCYGGADQAAKKYGPPPFRASPDVLGGHDNEGAPITATTRSAACSAPETTLMLALISAVRVGRWGSPPLRRGARAFERFQPESWTRWRRRSSWRRPFLVPEPFRNTTTGPGRVVYVQVSENKFFELQPGPVRPTAINPSSRISPPPPERDPNRARRTRSTIDASLGYEVEARPRCGARHVIAS